MTRRYSERDLFAWGDSLVRMADFSCEFGENPIQRMREYGCVVSPDFGADRALIPHRPEYIRMIDRQVARLDRQQRRALSAYYSAQLIDGQRPTMRQVAIAIGMNFNKFQEHLSRGKKRLLWYLNQ